MILNVRTMVVSPLGSGSGGIWTKERHPGGEVYIRIIPMT
jgi:hypothetical protein